jgi:hypothetical protein
MGSQIGKIRSHGQSLALKNTDDFEDEKREGNIGLELEIPPTTGP